MEVTKRGLNCALCKRPAKEHLRTRTGYKWLPSLAEDVVHQY